MSKKKFKLNTEMISWLDINKADYQEIAIDNQTFPQSQMERVNHIAKSPHTMLERRRLIMQFCDEFNMPHVEGVPEAIRMIGEWKSIKKYK